MYYVVWNEQPESEESDLGAALAYGISQVALHGEDRQIVMQEAEGAPVTAMYLLEADTKVDEEDVTFPVIVHTEALLVGVNA